MLGEILGRKAGDTWIEATLPRFLLPLGVSCGVFFALNDPDPGASCGLWLADVVAAGLAKMGEGDGCTEEPLAELGSGDGCSGVAATTERFCSLGKFADSGSSKFSIWSDAICSWLLTLAAELRLLGELNFIKEAGVAGDGMPGSCTPIT